MKGQNFYLSAGQVIFKVNLSSRAITCPPEKKSIEIMKKTSNKATPFDFFLFIFFSRNQSLT